MQKERKTQRNENAKRSATRAQNAAQRESKTQRKKSEKRSATRAQTQR
jgi:hypothetical protein